MKEIKIKFNLQQIIKDNRIDYDGKPEDEFPIVSYLQLYDILNITPIAEKYANEKAKLEKKDGRDSIAVLDHIFCNGQTIKNLDHFLTETWELYNLDIHKDNEVVWKPNKSRRCNDFLRTLQPSIKRSVALDHVNYKPGEDRKLEDNEITFFWEEDEIVLDAEREIKVTEKPSLLQDFEDAAEMIKPSGNK